QTADAAAWERHARAHRGAVRQALETARAQVVDTLRARGPAGARAAQSLIRLETADQIYGVLIAFGELLEHADPTERSVARRVMRRLRPLLVLLGEIILTDDPAASVRIRRAIDALAREADALDSGAPLRALMLRLVERLRIVQTLAVPANLIAGADAAGRPPPLLQRLWLPVRTNLTWRSPILRHATRAVTAAAPALAFTMWWFTPYDHWLTITIVATMQPFFALTYARAVERVLGTAAGGAIAAVIGAVCTTPLSIAAAMFPLSVLAFTVRSVSLGLFMFGLTPLVVLLVESAEPGTSEWVIAGARAALTTLGGMIAVTASFMLWPTREPAQLIAGGREAVAAHARYAEAVFAHLLHPGDGSALERARREAGIATNTFEATINRALLELRSDESGQLEAALVIDAALRRCAGRLSVLQFEAAGARETVPDAALAGWGAWIVAGLQHVASGDPDLPARPDLPGTDAIMR
ncbi:MAG: FUSC family protein, partial [Rhodospirillales bacterium]|nr:FUSC family protein [Rhodospirillales bacterium]